MHYYPFFLFFFFDLFIILLIFLRFYVDEIMAVLKLDSVTMGQTNWKPCSQQAWDQR